MFSRLDGYRDMLLCGTDGMRCCMSLKFKLGYRPLKERDIPVQM